MFKQRFSPVRYNVQIMQHDRSRMRRNDTAVLHVYEAFFFFHIEVGAQTNPAVNNLLQKKEGVIEPVFRNRWNSSPHTYFQVVWTNRCSGFLTRYNSAILYFSQVPFFSGVSD